MQDAIWVHLLFKKEPHFHALAFYERHSKTVAPSLISVQNFCMLLTQASKKINNSRMETNPITPYSVPLKYTK